MGQNREGGIKGNHADSDYSKRTTEGENLILPRVTILSIGKITQIQRIVGQGEPRTVPRGAAEPKSTQGRHQRKRNM